MRWINGGLANIFGLKYGLCLNKMEKQIFILVIAKTSLQIWHANKVPTFPLF